MHSSSKAPMLSHLLVSIFFTLSLYYWVCFILIINLLLGFYLSSSKSYLCVKGVAFQSLRCAMCRQEIPSDFLLHPQLLDRTQLEKESTLEDGYQWFYEGRNGKHIFLHYLYTTGCVLY